MAQDHLLVCFAISPCKCDNGYCFRNASHDVSTLLLGYTVVLGLVLVLQNCLGNITGRRQPRYIRVQLLQVAHRQSR